MCKQGHEWQAPVKRCLKDQGCPYCSGRKPIEGKNDIQSQNAFLASEWKQSKNGKSASEVSIRSGIKYWWTCSKCGFEWQATPANRSQGKGCHQCAKKLIGAKMSKEVHQYTINGEYIRSFESITEATAQTGVRHISSVCLGTRKSAGGYFWSYEKYE
jgi:hypothetical protein